MFFAFGMGRSCSPIVGNTVFLQNTADLILSDPETTEVVTACGHRCGVRTGDDGVPGRVIWRAGDERADAEEVSNPVAYVVEIHQFPSVRHGVGKNARVVANKRLARRGKRLHRLCGARWRDNGRHS